ncbi:beta-1,3-galactosyltransferase 5-like isoform X2 [Galleria mellonella]|uniref:Hexosyltransferase n=1 Tax=Galleria mellonella TaxID=7137 RepID=A0ABM3MW96_GALME|nr:beta-1,3-galactosyltransferase 5-like isoform X2 [Galleria mellonella]
MPVQLQVFTKRRAFSSVLICKIMRRKIKTLYIFVSMLSVCRWLAQIGSRALLLPSPPDQNLEHLRRNRSLKYYIDKTQLLIEPSSTPCDGVEEVPILVLVTSPPARFEQRSVIRSTWAKYQPTYFVMGLDGPTVDEQLVDNYVEAKQYGDLVIFDFQEHYHNLSLKTALMLQWTLDRCPQVEFLLKTDDDVFVNPWMLKQVVKDNKDAQLLGYRINNTYLHRDEYNKWYLPRWLYPDDAVSAYLSGTAYFISGEYISKILKAAFTVPLVNLEDIYFSYLVAKKYLHLTLFHDRRLSPQKPCFLIACVYWHLATAHSVSPAELANVWPKIETIANEFRQHEDVCKYYEILSSDLFLY